MAAQVRHQPVQFGVRAFPDELCHRTLISEVGEQVVASGASALKHERGIELVRTPIDPGTQGLPAGLEEGGFEQALDGISDEADGPFVFDARTTTAPIGSRAGQRRGSGGYSR